MATILTTTGVRFTADTYTAEELQAKVETLFETFDPDETHNHWLLLDDKGSMIRLDQVAAILA